MKLAMDVQSSTKDAEYNPILYYHAMHHAASYMHYHPK